MIETSLKPTEHDAPGWEAAASRSKPLARVVRPVVEKRGRGGSLTITCPRVGQIRVCELGHEPVAVAVRCDESRASRRVPSCRRTRSCSADVGARRPAAPVTARGPRTNRAGWMEPSARMLDRTVESWRGGGASSAARSTPPRFFRPSRNRLELEANVLALLLVGGEAQASERGQGCRRRVTSMRFERNASVHCQSPSARSAP